jgi:hypothetical protein
LRIDIGPWYKPSDERTQRPKVSIELGHFAMVVLAECKLDCAASDKALRSREHFSG